MLSSNEGLNGLLARYLREELRAVNKYLPVRRKSLNELLKEEYPHVMTRDGGTHMFRRSELKLLASLLNDEERESLLLPIIVEVRSEFKTTTAVVTDPTAAKALAKVLNLKEVLVPLYLYPPHLAILRRAVGSLIMYAFTLKE